MLVSNGKGIVPGWRIVSALGGFKDRQPSCDNREVNNKGRREVLNHGISEHPNARSGLLSLSYYPTAQEIKSFLNRLAPFHRTGRQGGNTDDPAEIH